MFQLTMLPAADGDCLLLSYGDGDHVRHLLIDGGRSATYPSLKEKLTAIGKQGQKIELLVLTHIDADHIEGLLPLAADSKLPIEISEVWFNGFDQLTTVKPMGPRQGDRFSDALRARGWKPNERFGGHTIAIDAAMTKAIELPGELKITLLSPDSNRLVRMRDEWEDWRTEAAARAKEVDQCAKRADGVQIMGRKPMPRTLDIDTLSGGKETLDSEAPNGSSIAFVADWKGKRVILTGDAHPDLLAEVLRPMAQAEGGRYRADLLKVSHHGSTGNTTRELVKLIDCTRFAISTNGTRHGHPDPDAIAKLLKWAPEGEKTLYFNYRQDRTVPWSGPTVRNSPQFVCQYPKTGNGELAIPI